MAYHRPETLDEALGILAMGPVQIAAGCTDLFPQTGDRGLSGGVLDITAIPDLRSISRSNGIRIGAATTWTDILRADLPPAFDGLKLAAREIGSVQIQNSGTIAGNLCTASPAGDSIPCLLTLNAEVELASAGHTRHLPLSKFLAGARQTVLRPGELVTAVQIPASAMTGRSDFLKLGARKYLVISIAMAAARLETQDDRITDASISVGACSPMAVRLTELERALFGVRVSEAARVVKEDLVDRYLSPISDIRADADYRRGAATELVRRLLMRFAMADVAAA